MKKILFSTALLAVILFAIFSSCTKEQVETVEPKLVSKTETPDLLGGPGFCTPIDRCSPSYFAVMATLFGPIGYPSPPGNFGEVDKILNCQALSYCEPACTGGSIVLDFNGSELPEVRFFSQTVQPPCTVAAQNQLIADVKALALQYAPTCPNTSIKYRVSKYDLYWDATTGIPGSFIIRALVTYIPPCSKYSEAE